MKRLFVLGAAVVAALVPVSVAPAHAAGVTVVVEGCPVTVAPGANGLAVLDAAVASGCPTVLSYEASSSPYGAFINCIDGLCGQTVLSAPTYPVNVGTYWGFYVNGSYSQVGVEGYSAHDLDVLLFDYEAYAY